MYTLTNNLESARNNIGGFEVKNVISNDDINYLHDYSESFKFEKAGVEHGRIDYENRNTSIFWIHPVAESEQIQSIFKKIRTKIIEINENIFQFVLTDMEPIQYTRYYMGDFYASHIDMSDDLLIGNTSRKLSFSIQLNDPSEYDGCDLVLHNGGSPIAACKDKGSMTLFPSFTLHEVTPVIKGTRNALVGWCWGPKFK